LSPRYFFKKFERKLVHNSAECEPFLIGIRAQAAPGQMESTKCVRIWNNTKCDASVRLTLCRHSIRIFGHLVALSSYFFLNEYEIITVETPFRNSDGFIWR